MTDAPAAAPVLTDAPVLAHLVRGGFVESVHRASVVVTAPDGSVEQVWGEASSPMFPRSSNKPVQALAMVRHGLDLPDDLLALVCASHSGEPFHLEGVRRILAGAGLSEEDLQNTPTLPLQEAEHDRWIREGLAPSSIAQNCSGKHAGMLATCVAAGWDTATYRDPGHPLQLAIADAVAELAGEPVSALAVDGCGAPVMAISLAGLALVVWGFGVSYVFFRLLDRFWDGVHPQLDADDDNDPTMRLNALAALNDEGAVVRDLYDVTLGIAAGIGVAAFWVLRNIHWGPFAWLGSGAAGSGT